MPSSRGYSRPGIKPASLMPPALAGRFFTTSTIQEAPTVSVTLVVIATNYLTKISYRNCAHLCASYKESLVILTYSSPCTPFTPSNINCQSGEHKERRCKVQAIIQNWQVKSIFSNNKLRLAKILMHSSQWYIPSHPVHSKITMHQKQFILLMRESWEIQNWETINSSWVIPNPIPLSTFILSNNNVCLGSISPMQLH